MNDFELTKDDLLVIPKNLRYEDALDRYLKDRAKGTYGNALDWLDRAIELAPCAEALPFLAQMRYEDALDKYRKDRAKGTYGNALDWLDRAIELAPCAEALPFLAQMRRETVARIPRRWSWGRLLEALRSAK